MKKLLFLTACFVCICFQLSAQTFQSKHFTIQKIAEGVYAAIATNGGHGICNAGIIDLGDATLIFDPFMTPDAAEDLKKAAEQLTGCAVKYVVNSHFHNDHIGGDQVFSGATLISTARTRELIAEYQPQEIEDDKKNVRAALEKITNEDTSTMTHHQLEEHTMWKGYYEALATSSNSLKVILPDITFADSLTIHGSNTTVKLISYGEGHTESDLFLYLPNEQIAFPGDLLFVQNQPWVGDGDVERWKTYLDKIASLNIKTLVPGHGPIGTLADIATMRDYFENVDEAAAAYHKKGLSPADDKALKSPAPFDSWFLSRFYRSNVIAEYNRLYKKPD